MQRIRNYRTRKEREDERQQRAEQRIVPRDLLDGAILEDRLWVKEQEDVITAHEGATKYLSVRERRHNLWCTFLERNAAVNSARFNDMSFGGFCASLKEDFDDMQVPPRDLARLTPDILYWDRASRVIHLGDVSVCLSVSASESRKTVKYVCLRRFLEECGFRVRQDNFLISADLVNVDGAVNKMRDIGVIGESYRTDLQTTKIFHEIANNVMSDIELRVKNKTGFYAIVDESRTVMSEDLDKSYGTMRMEEPVQSEEVFAKVLRHECDKLYNGYFDSGYSDAKASFVELYEGFSRRPEAEPKSTLQVVHNSGEHETLTGHSLLSSYVDDIRTSDDTEVSYFLLNILPTMPQIKEMSTLNDSKEHRASEIKVHGRWQYTPVRGYSDTYPYMRFRDKVSRTKHNPNRKTEPATIRPTDYESIVSFMDLVIDDLGEESNKPPPIPDVWTATTNIEKQNTETEKYYFDLVRKSKGLQLAHSLSHLYQRVTHVRSSLGSKYNVYVPPNSSFVCIIPSNHAPITSRRVELPMIVLTRYRKGSRYDLNEFEYTLDTKDYTYLVSSLFRLPIEKICNWDQSSYKIAATSTFLLSTSVSLQKCYKRVIGTITLLSLDIHQKTSELLDLLKYVSFMPFSHVSRLSKLVLDKFDIMLKTRLDVWVLKTTEDFMDRLAAEGSITAQKKKVQTYNGVVISDCLGMDITIPSFINKGSKHCNIQSFIEEVSAVNTVRGKHFYGGQFMDKSITNTVDWNIEYIRETMEHGDWAVGGTGDISSFPFKAKFCYSKDAILHAMNHNESVYPVNRKEVCKKIGVTNTANFMHYNCSLRGCTKEKKDRENNDDLHSTSMDECLKFYESMNFKDEDCTSLRLAEDYIKPSYTAQYCLSEKDQRGGGRPIATGTLTTKAGNMMIEKPEQAIGMLTKSNIVVAGKNKLKEQSEAFREAIRLGAEAGRKKIYQLTEDQSKFSENDNTRKYKVYIANNRSLPVNIRSMQMRCLEKMETREHLVKHLPVQVTDDPQRRRWVNSDNNGVKAVIGWPQGMLNNISTSIHCFADRWATHMYNKAYGANIRTNGLVHSDDSWVAVACDSLEEFKRYTIFRMLVKRMMCLKLNEKKVWGSPLMGELVSNFNINGEMMVPVAKIIANMYNNLLFMSWPIDVNSNMSSLQQLLRNGATLGTVIVAHSLLKCQIFEAYKRKDTISGYDVSMLPIELGGYPSCSTFELAVTGLSSHYRTILQCYDKGEADKERGLVSKVVSLTMRIRRDKDERGFHNVGCVFGPSLVKDLDNAWRQEVQAVDEQYENIVIPNRADVFGCIKHLLPRSTKITKTVQRLKSLPFETDELELIEPRPKELKLALGHLKSQTSTLVYSLASEKITGNRRRLAISQSLQASGKTVRIGNMMPMTLEEVLRAMSKITIEDYGIDCLRAAFEDDTHISDLASAAVYHSDIDILGRDKRKMINHMPRVEDKFNTVAQLKNVLCYIIDESEGHEGVFYRMHSQGGDQVKLVEEDADRIKHRFSSYFAYYNSRKACNLIMQQYYYRTNYRIWTQPELSTDSIEAFISSLYGKVLNSETNYKVTLNFNIPGTQHPHTSIVDTMYTISVLNSLYEGCFNVCSFRGQDVSEFLGSIDYTSLSSQHYFKFAILCQLWLGDDTHMREYDSKKQFTVKYIKAQRNNKGKYLGRFDILVKYGKTTMRLIGQPGDLYMMSSTNNISEILFGMWLFVNRDHSEFRYAHPGLWYTSMFWQTKTNIQTYKLIGYTPNSTMIKHSGANDTDVMSFVLNPHMKNILEHSSLKVIGYKVSKHNRIVTKEVMYPDGSVSEVRVDNVSQSMACPITDGVIFEPAFIDGFENALLFKTKAIVNVTLRRSFKLSNELARQLLKSKLHGLNRMPLARFCLSLFAALTKSNILLPEQEVAHEEIEVEIGGMCVNTLSMLADNTEPEDLSAIETDYLIETQQRGTALTKYNELTRMICASVTGSGSGALLEDTIRYILSNRECIKVLLAMKNDAANVEETNSNDWGREDPQRYIEDFLEYDSEADGVDELVILILGNRWDIRLPLTPEIIENCRQTRQEISDPRSVQVGNIVKMFFEDQLGLGGGDEEALRELLG